MKNLKSHPIYIYIRTTCGNKLIRKPPLKIDEVIEHLTSNKNNIEIVNWSSTVFHQMLLSGKKAPKIAIQFKINVDDSDYFTTSTFNNVVRSQVGIFFIMHKNTHSFWKCFWRISFIFIWIKSCSWRYCVISDLVLCQHLSWCLGLHRLSYISCWQNRRRCLRVH